MPFGRKRGLQPVNGGAVIALLVATVQKQRREIVELPMRIDGTQIRASLH